MATKRAAALSLALAAVAWPQDRGLQDQRVPLTVPAGVPLRLYLTKRVPKRANAPAQAKLLTPVYTFDREAIPAGTEVLGHVSSLHPVSRGERTKAVLAGDFTPLHVARIEFTSLRLPDGRALELHTIESPGLNSLVPLTPPKQRQSRGQLGAQIDRIKGIPEMVRGIDKKEWLYDYVTRKLPWHPQSIRNRTRFDAELREPLDFGSEMVAPPALALLGTHPAPGSIAHARLITPLDSLSSKLGDKVRAVLDEPLFAGDKRLVLPQGTMVEGSVAMAKKAGWFHRGGRLRFSFQNIDLAPQLAALGLAPVEALPTQATVNAVEGGGTAPLKVDSEGGVQATESKTRFLGTALAAIAAGRAADNDPVHAPTGAVIGRRRNVGGRTLGGGLGFGLLGSIAAQSSHTVGAAFGYYGLAWSVYSNIVARGQEVRFEKNAVVDIAFNQRTGPTQPAEAVRPTRTPR